MEISVKKQHINIFFTHIFVPRRSQICLDVSAFLERNRSQNGGVIMRIIIQRVKQASVTVEQRCIGKMESGLLLFLGIGQTDDEKIARKMFDKVSKLRIFSDENDKTNLSIQDVNGEILVISQFTLYADCKKGNRPSFTNAADPKLAKSLYEYFLSLCREKFEKVEQGEFGADMKVELINDGPFTIVLDSEQL